jgi:hypothetical protein
MFNIMCYMLLLTAMQVGDHIIVDGGMCELVVTAKAGPDVLAQSIEQGLLLSKANLTFRCGWVGARVCFWVFMWVLVQSTEWKRLQAMLYTCRHADLQRQCSNIAA